MSNDNGMARAKPGMTEYDLRLAVEKTGLSDVVWSDMVQDDLSNSGVGFDCENFTAEPGEYDMNGFEPGYGSLPNGVPVLWVGAGGDWEGPVAFCVYIGVDGTLRAYVPKDGNVYNRETGKAYGNDDDMDQYYVEPFDMGRLAADAGRAVIAAEAGGGR